MEFLNILINKYQNILDKSNNRIVNMVAKIDKKFGVDFFEKNFPGEKEEKLRELKELIEIETTSNICYRNFLDDLKNLENIWKNKDELYRSCN